MVNLRYFVIKYKEWRNELYSHKYLIFVSLIFVGIAILIGYLAGFYVSYKAECVIVPDLILKYFGPYDFSFFYVWTFLIIIFAGVLYPLFFNVKKLHTAIAQCSFLVMVRSFFIILTHLQTPLDAVSKGRFPWILNILNFHNDQFFSGHVAIPFLGFLLFKESKIRYLFLIGSIVMSIVVLGMHQHYSIDVFAAFFITYGSYKIVNYLLKKIKFDSSND